MKAARVKKRKDMDNAQEARLKQQGIDLEAYAFACVALFARLLLLLLLLLLQRA